MNYRCEHSENQKHTFYQTAGKHKTIFTCITCGERRAVTDLGELMWWNDAIRLWEVQRQTITNRR